MNWAGNQQALGAPSAFGLGAPAPILADGFSETIFEVGNTFCRIYGAPPYLQQLLAFHTRYPSDVALQQTEGWKPPEAYIGEDYWDGWIHLTRFPAQGPGITPTGLLDLCQWVCQRYGFAFSIDDSREVPLDGLPDLHTPVVDRDYQLAAVEAALREGRGVLDMPPRSGKTRTGIEIQRRLALPAIWIAPTTNIVKQTVRAFKGFFGENYVGHLVGASNWRGEVHCRVVICTAATARDLPPEFFATRDMLFIDEFHHCFSPTTLVTTPTGPREIQCLRAGDEVFADTAEGVVPRKVARVWKRTPPPTMLRIGTTVGTMEVTSEHEVFTSDGKKRAGDLRVGSIVHVLEVRPENQAARSVSPAREGLPGPQEENQAVPYLRRRGEAQIAGGTRADVFGAESFCEPRGASTRDEGPLRESELSTATQRAHAREKSNAFPHQSCANDGGNPASDSGRANGGLRAWHRRQRFGPNFVRAKSLEDPQATGFRARGGGEDREQKGRGSDLVQPRFRAALSESCGGNRRVVPSESAGCRRQEGCFSSGDRLGGDSCSRESSRGGSRVVAGEVLSVEIFPSTCAAVYDLEVEHDHNYFAEGVKVSNSAAKTYHELVAKCPSIYYRYGMTGTFFRSGEDALAMHAVLSKTIYKVTAEELVERGYLVPTDVCYLPVNGPRAKGGPTFQTGCGKNGIYQHEYRTDLAAWATQVLTHHGHKVLVLVGTKEQGNTILDRLKHQYPTPAGRQFRAVEFVSTNRPAHICQNIIDTFAESSAIQVLIGTSMVGEGTDLPNTAACVYCPGQKAEVPLIQAAYRACTAVPGKTRALFVDFSDRHHRTLMDHSLERLSVFWKEATFNVEVLEDASFFGAWVANRPR